MFDESEGSVGRGIMSFLEVVSKACGRILGGMLMVGWNGCAADISGIVPDVEKDIFH